jgi:hypothetical protein
VEFKATVAGRGWDEFGKVKIACTELNIFIWDTKINWDVADPICRLKLYSRELRLTSSNITDSHEYSP